MGLLSIQNIHSVINQTLTIFDIFKLFIPVKPYMPIRDFVCPPKPKVGALKKDFVQFYIKKSTDHTPLID